MKYVICSGYFNPVHKGHIDYLEQASKKGELIVIVNNDKQVELKGSKPFQDMAERIKIISALKFADYVVPSIDEDKSVCKTIEDIVELFREKKGNNIEFIFAKGGDRNSGNIPEKEICDKYKIPIVDGLGDKIQSSSKLLDKVIKWSKKKES